MSNFPKDLCIPIRDQLHELDSENKHMVAANQIQIYVDIVI